MSRIELAPEVMQDFERFLEHLLASDATDAAKRIAEIAEAIQVLAHSPLIGRRAQGGRRELVIGRGSRGYVALYRFVPELDTVFVLALRSQRELGYKH